MANLSFSLSQEEIKQERYLVVSISLANASSKRILYAPDIKNLAEEKDKEAISSLIEAALRFQKKPIYSDISTLALGQVFVEKSLIEKVVKALAKTGKVFYKNQKVFIDPLSTLKLEYRVEDKGDSLLVAGVMSQGSLSFPIEECEEIFFGEKIFILHKGMFKSFTKDIDAKWLSLVYPQKASLVGNKKKQFEDLFIDEDPPIYGPKAFWIGEKVEEVESDPLPLLVLNDRTGAFANLFMDYGKKGLFLLSDTTPYPFRKKELEKYWEKDLLETDFLKKVVGKTSYYCPLDKVAKSLSFLLEMGWKIQDSKGKNLVKQTSLDAEVKENAEFVLFQGKANFSNFQADLTGVIGTFNKRNLFVELSDTEVGLLDFSLLEDWKILEDAELSEEGYQYKKERMGELAAFFDKEEVKWDENLTHLIQAAKNHTSSECIITEDFKGALFPHQQAGINWLKHQYECGFSGLLADEMGLGKTIQVIAFLSTLLKAQEKPILIVSSTSLIGHWKSELRRFLPSASFRVFDKNTKEQGLLPQLNQNVILTTYPILRLEEAEFKKYTFLAAILDEAQIIKNPGSQTASAAFSLKASFRLALTGTPIENRWEDIWSIFHFLQPSLLGELSAFRAKALLSSSNKTHLAQLKNRLRPFILRREKKEVAKDLPEKIEQEIFVEMSEAQRGLYEEVLKKRKKEVLSLIEEGGLQKNRMHVLEAILRLRQIATLPELFSCERENFADKGGKLPKILEDIEAIREGKEKVLIFSQFTSFLKILSKELMTRNINYCYLDGETKDRDKEVDRFQKDENVSVFLISLKAGGMGLNLQSADYVFLCEPWWNEAVEQQAIDRAHRIGRLKPVIARRYLTYESIEEKMQKIKEHKKALVTSAFSLDEVGNLLSNDELYELLLQTFEGA